MTLYRGVFAQVFLWGAIAIPGLACAQHADENPVADAGDAFGTKVGLETVGIYSETETRGFNPTDAGNARIDGIYYDPIGAISSRLRESTTIRVGTAAQGFPFQAPTGIVDHKYRPMPLEFGNSFTAKIGELDGYNVDWDLRAPIIPGKFGLTGGLYKSRRDFRDGTGHGSWGYTVRPIFRLGDVEVAPFVSSNRIPTEVSHTLIVPTGAVLPGIPDNLPELIQDWRVGRYRDVHRGVTLKAKITDRLALKSGLFRSAQHKVIAFTEIYAVNEPGGLAQHLLIADPERVKKSTSGEAILEYHLGDGKWNHRLLAGFRGRDRLTETGGSDRFDFGQVQFGVPDPQPEPEEFDFSAVNAGRVRQSAAMLGYIGSLDGVGRINLGLQKARYRAVSRDAQTGLEDKSRANPWLYNATLSFDISPSLSAFVGSQRGLEDRGVAPETATNRNEQLPSTIATQYEGGLHWKFGASQFVVNAFQITKPYFSYDTLRRFVELGNERHLGIESSLSGHFGRLTVLGGVIAMKRKVAGAAVDAGIVGKLPTGIPALRGRIDANYQTDIFGGLTPTVAVVFQSRSAVGSRPLAALDGRQLMVPGYAMLDLGVRQKFTIGSVPASFRAVFMNVFDNAHWKVIAPDTLLTEEPRAFVLNLSADF